MAVAVADKRGLKRICTSCGTRFYDLNKRPIMCPNCTTEFTGDMKLKTKRARPATVAEDEEPILKSQVEEQDNDVVEEEEIVAAEADTVSLEEAEEIDETEDDADDETPDADLDLDEEEDDLDDDEDDDEEEEDEEE